MPIRSSRQRSRQFRLFYGVAALAALAGGALLALYTRGEILRPDQSPAGQHPTSFLPPGKEREDPANREKDEQPVIPRGKDIRVEVLNGCGEAGVVDKFSRLLRSEGFDVIKAGNARSFSYVESMVIDRAGKRGLADEVARALRIKAVIQQVKDDPYRIEDVTVVIGRDHRKLGLR